MPQQCRLADPGLTTQHERAALAARRDLQQAPDCGAFALSANQRAGRPLELGRGHPTDRKGRAPVRPVSTTGEITDAFKGSLADP